MENIFVIMPAYNAGRTIESVFDRIPEDARRVIRKYFVVNDGSVDDTQEAIDRLQAKIPNLVPLRHPQNRGYGAAEKTLLNAALEAGVDVAVLLHSDGQYSPEKIPTLLEPFTRDEAEIVQGSRMLGGGALKGGMPFYKYVSNKILTGIENFTFGMKMAEYHSGYMLYNRRCLEAIPFNRLSDSFDFDLEMLVAAHILSLRIKEIAIPTIYATEKSYLNPIQYGLDVLNICRRYRRGEFHRLLGLDRN